MKKVVSIEPRKFFYSRKQAAFALGFSVRKLDYLISEQKFRTRRVGGNVVIPTEDIEKFAAQVMRSDMLETA